MTDAVLRLIFASASDDEPPASSPSRAPRDRSAARAGERETGHPIAGVSGTDAQLAERIRAGDVDAITHVVRTYLPLATNVAARLVGSRDAAMDIVQEVCAQLWKHRSSFYPTRSIKSYLISAVYYQAKGT